jgi:hypothetical protein
MLDILLAQIGLTPDGIQEMVKRAMRGLDNIERRLARIEQALNIPAELPPGEFDDIPQADAESIDYDG